jgi:hypothetical protein
MNVTINSFKQLTSAALRNELYSMRTIPLHKTQKTLLPPTFKPLPYSVVIGRGKEPANATGNRRLTIFVKLQLQNYTKAKSRQEKSVIVSNVLETVQEACPGGAFVKFDGRNWWEVDDNTAREKIGSMFRDCLHSRYKSSTKAKMAKRRAKRGQGLLYE